MRFCPEHWDKLRAAIDDEGLTHLIARDGHAAIANMISELETGSRRENFDPLMGAHFAIVNRIAEHAPQVVLIEGCPLCWVKDFHDETCKEPDCGVTRETFEDWIPGVAAFMRQEHDAMVAEDAER